MKTLFSFSIVVLLTVSSINAQSSDWGEGAKDFYDQWSDDYRPWIELNYGAGNLKQNDYSGFFQPVGQAQIKLGYSSITADEDNILDENTDFIFFSMLSDRYKLSTPSGNDARSDSWQLGFGFRNGFGYDVGSFSISPYNQRGAIWSMLDVTDHYYRDVIDNPGDRLDPESGDFSAEANMLNRYDGTFRFGLMQEAGINFYVSQFIGFGVGYEFNTIFPRVLFWKAGASLLLHEVAQGSVTYFIQEIMDSSPTAGPIVYFLLKNGLSYAYYSLTKKYSNWPFNTETPITYETLKFNISFAF
ncbi:MAG: hypothetical protein GXO87_09055 [Chlorobi bacterium]|nr:hypothetical protein [Chlorobiota bacterium]